MARQYTENQLKFLEVLFDEANGDVATAKKLAGYAEGSSTTNIVKSLKEEILEATQQYMARNAPKAAVAMAGALLDPTELGIRDKMSAAKELLDRTGLVKTEKMQVEATGGVMLMPPKAKAEEDDQMGSFVTKQVLKGLIGVAKKQLKKTVRNKPLNSTQKRNSENAMETFDDLMADQNLNIKGATKPSALIGNQRMNRAINRIAEGKTQTQTDAVNALLQGAGVSFAVGADAVARKKTTTKSKTKKKPPLPRSKPKRKTPPLPKKKPPLRTRVGMAKK